MMPLVSTATVFALHDAALAAHGGAPGDGKGLPCVEGSIGAAANAVLYRFDCDDYIDPKWFAAYAFLYLLKNHCFTDGNKRVAWMVLTHTLYQQLEASLSIADAEVPALVLEYERRARSGVDLIGLVGEFVSVIDQHLVAA